MSSTCVCHQSVLSIGYACSHCLSLHCLDPIMDQLKEIDKDKKEFKKKFDRNAIIPAEEERNYIKNVTYPTLDKKEEQDAHRACKVCHKKFE